MCKGLIGKKLGMSTIFSPDGRMLPVTVVRLGPCTVTQVKTRARDGYDALQLGFEEKKPEQINKPKAGHLKKSGSMAAVLREVPVAAPDEFSVGQVISSDIFEVGEKVDVTGISKGRGFSGVMKRHGFSGGRKTHGSKCHRIPGSIGCSAYPARVIKGKRLPGQYGNTRKTIRCLEIVDIRPEENLVLLKGAVPGATSGEVMIRKAKLVK
ncbi:MAG: 50S ribosomal protein L3 [Desulfococcus sp.]|nr:MAG: 50S ribosomal protein L3 [Desulfococcus sp.]